jgi:hypothetical protein
MYPVWTIGAAAFMTGGSKTGVTVSRTTNWDAPDFSVSAGDILWAPLVMELLHLLYPDSRTSCWMLKALLAHVGIGSVLPRHDWRVVVGSFRCRSTSVQRGTEVSMRRTRES